MNELFLRVTGRANALERLAGWLRKINPPETLAKRPLRYDIPKKIQIALHWPITRIWLTADGQFVRDDTREVIGHLTKA